MVVRRIGYRGLKTEVTGASLLEMLIALFVMGVGMMGVLAMQAQSVRLNHQAYSYSQAVFLAQDILESMRSNRDAAKSYEVTWDDEIANTTDCGQVNANCSAEQIKNWDISRWRESIQKRLPGGQSSIVLDGDTFTINIEFTLVDFEKENSIAKVENDRQKYTLTAGL